ncbi:hypothetical protein CFO_g870 [Ceratocystis platani]|uniref:Uncharacterized protein n=1 Tax=Ceratocystis fimbriata f. sp. platani TaxID=88771 RepID=A0A0F8DLP6_CERFI|nr:hypothetical protein CFO_g870 [Ceratocystis platani]
MNRFRTKRKGKDKELPTMSLPKVSSEEPMPSPSGFKLFGKGKKSIEEPKVEELDLDNALPSQDDFRTSLLMTGLSARFSMLREQDDPNTKIGKASDDSVLFSNRASRGMDFMLGGGLGDIAEVESIRSRQFARMGEYQSSDDGESIMNRGKPVDGNNLFGGRQKIYKISPSGTMGKALYEDDVSMSAFQRWKIQEKERLMQEQTGSQYDTLVTEPEEQRPPSPPSFVRKRSVNSPTMSSNTMSSIPSLTMSTSTTATSLLSESPTDVQTTTSAPPAPSVSHTQSQPESQSQAQPQAQSTAEKSVARTRRLYEQSLNQELHDHQNSSLNRMDTLARRFGPRTTEHPIGNMLIDRGVGPDRRLLAKSSAPNLKARSTSGSSVHPPLDNTKSDELKPPFGAVPPLSPPMSDAGEVKATKPGQTYDESRYAQRQLQLKQGRFTPAQSETGSIRSSSHSESTTADGTDGIMRRIPPAGRVPGKLDPNRLTFLEADEPEFDRTRSPSVASTAPSRRSFVDHSDHPALRDNPPLPSMPLVVNTAANRFDPISPISEASANTPGGSGLSGMVRAHLRNDSSVSSVYDDEPSNEPLAQVSPLAEEPIENFVSGTATPQTTTDEFANQLADRARIVREKLNSLNMDGDGSRPASPSIRKDVASRTSKGSLRERKSIKMLNISNPISATPSPSRFNFEEAETALPSPAIDHRSSEDEGPSLHPGLKQFRQARREMQRHLQSEPQSPGRTRNPSRPPVSYYPRDSGEMGQSISSRASSDIERDRSNSDASSSSRMARPTMRSAGSYTNGGRPQVPPPQGMYGSRANSPGDHSTAMTTHGRIGEVTPATPASPLRLDESMRRRVSKKEISEPMFVSSSSRVPTVTLPEGQSRSRSTSGSNNKLRIQTSSPAAPPLPPINPRRRNMMGGIMGRKEEEPMITPYFPPTPMSPEYPSNSREPVDEFRTMPGGLPGGMF